MPAASDADRLIAYFEERDARRRLLARRALVGVTVLLTLLLVVRIVINVAGIDATHVLNITGTGFSTTSEHIPIFALGRW